MALTQNGRPPIDLELVVPALNEEHRLGPTLDALADHLSTLPVTAALIVVDNGSIDRTSALCSDRAVPVTVIGCAEVGKGAAVRRGILRTSAHWVGYCDADLATSPDCLDTAVAALAAGHRAIVGSRANAASRVEERASWVRHAGAYVFRRIAARVVPDVSDTQCGFKFFDGDLVRGAAAELVATGFAFDVELLARVRRHAPLVEIPVDWVDTPGSTFSPWRHGLRAFVELDRIRRRITHLPPLTGGTADASPAAIPAPRSSADNAVDLTTGGAGTTQPSVR